MRAIRVGIVGFGELGKYLLDQMKQQPDKFEVVFIHNRTPVDHPLFVSSVKGHAVDLVVEVAHPCVIKNLGLLELGCDVFVGSPTAFAEGEWSVPANVAVFVPVGALWGADDISKMRANIASLTVSMHKHPEHLRSVLGPVRAKLDAYMADEKDESPCVLYSGPVRALCPLAPNNVNTLACAALCGPGFDATTGCLVADKSLTGHHVVKVEVVSKGGLEVTTIRKNPAKLGAVTGSATFASFFASLLRVVATSKPKGQIHIV